MISVAEARRRILAGLPEAPCEHVSLENAAGRVLAEDIRAARTQPPAAVSAMDGYAVRAADMAGPAPLRLIGVAAAGHGFDGSLGAGETVRIFTGAPMPPGADAVLIQEDADIDGDRVTPKSAPAAGDYVRPAGMDFSEGDPGLRAGVRIAPRHLGLLAAMNIPWVPVRRRPLIALLSTGDELVRPGEAVGRDQIISSNALSTAATVRLAGGAPLDIGIAPDQPEALARCAANAAGADMLVTLGGASVGDHDLVRDVLGGKGLDLDFWRIAMRPGKPLMFGKFGDIPLLGLPGNPVSALVCSLIFLRPAIHKMLGLADTGPDIRTGTLGAGMGENDRREDYVRARLEHGPAGEAILHPFAKQDSAMLSVMSEAGALVVRAPHAPALKPGDPVEYAPLHGRV